MSEAPEIKLTEAQLATLREMSGYPKEYWFRQATAKSLVFLGLAEPIQPNLKRHPHRITQAGRDYLKSIEA